MQDNSRLNYSSAANRPDFLILGVQKSATTTLFDILNSLGGFSGSSRKELHFFDSDHNYQKGVEWYLDCFSRDAVAKKFEATPSYIYMRDVPQRIYSDFGAMKFIVMLRDPVKRCFSAWNMFRVFNSDRSTAEYIYDAYIKDCNSSSRDPLRELLFTENYPTFEQCVDRDLFIRGQGDLSEEPSFVRRGFYHEQVLRFLEYYSIQDFLFLEHDEFSSDTLGGINRICDFLGVASSYVADSNKKVSNKGDYEGIAIDAYTETFLKLYDLYHEPNQQLFSLIGKEYPWNASWLTL
jgi:hypothetical protein